MHYVSACVTFTYHTVCMHTKYNDLTQQGTCILDCPWLIIQLIHSAP
jgi:hypothetical protein